MNYLFEVCVFTLICFIASVQSQGVYDSVCMENVTTQVFTGDNVHWDADQQAWYFVSIFDNLINKYDAATRKHTKTQLAGRAGFIIPVAGTKDLFLLGTETKIFIVKWNGCDAAEVEVIKRVGEIEQSNLPHFINHGKVDPKGRVFVGTMVDKTHESYPQKGILYKIDDTKMTKVDDYIVVSNALEWDIKQKIMYYSDIIDDTIKKYRYDPATGNFDASNPKIVFKYDDSDCGLCNLEGTTLDTDGNIWATVYNGSSVVHVNPNTGKIIQKYPLEAKEVTSLAFGGPYYNELFVTTGRVYRMQELDGTAFIISGLGVKGIPKPNFIYTGL